MKEIREWQARVARSLLSVVAIVVIVMSPTFCALLPRSIVIIIMSIIMFAWVFAPSVQALGAWSGLASTVVSKSAQAPDKNRYMHRIMA